MRIKNARLAAGAVAAAAVLAAAPTLQAPAQAGGTGAGKKGASDVLVVGHRGASGYRPEHTLAAYELAIALGADVIEPDLVSTKDGVLVARHENEIGGTTDVGSKPQFADRKRTTTIDGVSTTGWFTEDFTLAELRTLRAIERIPLLRQENTLYDGRYQVPTLDEVLDLARRAGKERKRTIGVAPETKHPTYFDGLGLSLEEPLLATLKRFGLTKADSPVYVQSFETANLRELSTRTQVPLVQLFGGNSVSPTGTVTPAQPWDAVVSGSGLTYDQMATPAGLREIARYADVVGPNKARVIPVVGGRLASPTALVGDAHARGLQVFPYTFRNENQFLPPALRRGTDLAAYGDAFSEYAAFYAAGVDAVFSDNPDTAVRARDERVAAAG